MQGESEARVQLLDVAAAATSATESAHDNDSGASLQEDTVPVIEQQGPSASSRRCGCRSSCFPSSCGACRRHEAEQHSTSLVDELDDDLEASGATQGSDRRCCRSCGNRSCGNRSCGGRSCGSPCCTALCGDGGVLARWSDTLTLRMRCCCLLPARGSNGWSRCSPIYQLGAATNWLSQKLARARDPVLNPLRRHPLRWFDVSYTTVLLVLVYLALNATYLLAIMPLDSWTSIGSGSTMGLAKAIGKLMHVNYAVMFVPATRSSIFNLICGGSFERAIRFHRWVGRWTYVLLNLHCLFVLVDWATSSEPFFSLLGDELFTFKNIMGELASIALTLMFVTSLGIFRRYLFELFYKMHLLLIIPLMVFSMLHHKWLHMLLWISITFTLYVLDVLLRFWMLSCRHCELVSLTPIANEAVRVVCRQPSSYLAGQYMFLYIPQVAALQVHPISISSPPGSEYTTFHVKVTGDWSRQLLDLAKSPSFSPADTVLKLEGPYGFLSLPPLDRYSIFLFFAGGIGITPLMSIVRELCAQPHDGHRQIVFVWTMHTPGLFLEFKQVLLSLMNQEGVSLRVHITGDGDASVDASVQATDWVTFGKRPDTEALFLEMRDKAIEADTHKVATLACGPSSMLYDVRKATTYLSDHTVRFDLHKETFHL